MSQGPLLTDATGMGGLNASDGFDYQIWNTLTRIPGWLSQPSFEGLIFEGFEDIEARFFNPYTPQQAVLERFQAKSGSLDKSDLLKVFLSFKAFSDRHPDVARLHTLITPMLPPLLKWIQRDSDRIRKAKPFYLPFQEVITDSLVHHIAELNKEFKPDIGSFIATDVAIDYSTLSSTREAQIAFALSLEQSFPHLNVSPAKVVEAFHSIVSFLGETRGSFVSSYTLSRILSEKLGGVEISGQELPVHITSDREIDLPRSIVIDTSLFTGAYGRYPEDSIWQDNLVKPLQSIALWARKMRYNLIKLSGSYRLSTSFIIGWAFRSAVGFEISITTREGEWLTNDRPTNGTSLSQWQISNATMLNDGKLIVCIGIIRDPSSDLIAMGISHANCIQSAWLAEPLTSAQDTQLGVLKIKTAISTVAATLKPKMIDLYYAGPAAFTVALGHRWNGMPLTQLHEFNSITRQYQPTALIQ